MYLAVEDVDRRVYGLTHRRDVEVELVAAPARLHLGAAGDVLLKLVDIVGDSAARFFLAEIVGQVDVDGLTHMCDVARRLALFKHRHGSMFALMKLTAAPLALIASAATAQPLQPQPTAPSPPLTAQPAP